MDLDPQNPWVSPPFGSKISPSRSDLLRGTPTPGKRERLGGSGGPGGSNGGDGEWMGSDGLIDPHGIPREALDTIYTIYICNIYVI